MAAESEAASNLITLIFGTTAGGTGLGVASKIFYDWIKTRPAARPRRPTSPVLTNLTVILIRRFRRQTSTTAK